MAEASKIPEGPIIQLDIEGKSLYLLDRLFNRVGADNPMDVRRDYFGKALSALVRIYGRAREGAPLWYKSEALRFRGLDADTTYDPSVAEADEDDSIRFDTENIEFDGELVGGDEEAASREIEPEGDRVPIFPVVAGNAARLYKDEIDLAKDAPTKPASPGSPIVVPAYSKPDGVVTWHNVMLDAIEQIPDVPGTYAEPGRRIRLRVVDKAADAYLSLMHHADRLTGNPITDLMLTALCIGNGLRDLQEEGEFYFEDIAFPVPEPVTFFRRS